VCGLGGEHFHQARLAVGAALGQVVAVVVVEGQLAKGQGLGEHGRGQELGLAWKRARRLVN